MPVVPIGADGIPEQGEYPSLVPVVRSARWGQSYPLILRNAAGRYWVPARARAGNIWSYVTIDPNVATSLGGVPGKVVESEPGNTSNPWGARYKEPGRSYGFDGWFFDAQPDAKKLEDSATFVGGRGTSNKTQLQGLGLLAAALTAGAALAPAAAGASGLTATVSNASTLSELTAGGLGTGGGTGLSVGSAGQAAGAILGNPAAIAPAGLPGTGLSLSGAAGSGALSGFGAGTVVAGGAGLMASPITNVLTTVNTPAAAATPPATSPFSATPVISSPAAAPVAAPASSSIVQSVTGAIKTGAAAAQTAAQTVGAALTLKSLLTGKPDQSQPGDANMLMPPANPAGPIMAPPVVVTGKPDDSFLILLAGLSFLVWRL